jgi:hypothetical protein
LRKEAVVGVPNVAFWQGDGVNAGVLGLAYPDLTNAYSGTDPSKDNFNDYKPYNSFMFTVTKEKAIQPCMLTYLVRTLCFY